MKAVRPLVAFGFVASAVLGALVATHWGFGNSSSCRRPTAVGSSVSGGCAGCRIALPAGRTHYAPSFPDPLTGELPPRDSALAAVLGELELTRAKLLLLRQHYGRLHCTLKGTGPTGGFCPPADPVEAEAAENGHLDEPLCRALAALLSAADAASLGDFGAGLGQYGRCLAAELPRLTYRAYDGAERTTGSQSGHQDLVQFLDLAESVWLGVRYDWILSLDVGEHLAKAYEQAYLDNVARHAGTGVVMSWAPPDEPAPGHVNGQPNSYIVGQMAARGLVHDEAASDKLRGAAEAEWFKGSLMVFRRSQPWPRVDDAAA